MERSSFDLESQRALSPPFAGLSHDPLFSFPRVGFSQALPLSLSIPLDDLPPPFQDLPHPGYGSFFF